MLRAIEHFGGDHEFLKVHEYYAIGYQGCWVVPEEIGEQQPLKTSDGKWFLFYGRVDNRVELLQLLNEPKDLRISDAELLLNFLEEFGESVLSQVQGPFVFALFDPQNGSLVAARDGMGGRYLACFVTNELILIATYELAIVASGAVPYSINDEKAARILMGEMEAVPSSTIDNITPLLPGECLTLRDGSVSNTRFYQPDPKRRIALPDDEAYAREFKRLLTQAVKRRLRSIGNVGTMLSGGMDSVPVTILAAQQHVQTVTAFSWVFDQFPDLDERKYSAPICRQFGIEQVLINCDEVWPKFNADTHVNPIFPFGIPYSEFQQETFRRARSKGVKVLLTGMDGDLLYEGGQSVFYELLSAGRYAEAWQEFRRFWNSGVSRLQFIKYYFLKPLSFVKKVVWFKNRNTSFHPDCLQATIVERISKGKHWLELESRNALRPDQWRIVLDGFAGEDSFHGRYMEAKYGIERRYPFRDRELCEFMLAIPSERLQRSLLLSYWLETTRQISTK